MIDYIIINEDCLTFLKSEYFKKILSNEKLCIITDPPFNINYKYNSYKDKINEEEYYNKLKEVLTMHNLPFVVVHYPECLYKLTLKIGVAPTKVVSRVYNSNTSKQHRDIAFFNIKPNFNKVKQPYKNPNDKRIKERIAKGIGGGETI